MCLFKKEFSPHWSGCPEADGWVVNTLSCVIHPINWVFLKSHPTCCSVAMESLGDYGGAVGAGFCCPGPAPLLPPFL